MPPTPPSSHGSDSEGSQSPVHAPPGLSCPASPTSPAPSQAGPKASPRAASSLSNSPLLTAAHVSNGARAADTSRRTPSRGQVVHVAFRVRRSCRARAR